MKQPRSVIDDLSDISYGDSIVLLRDKIEFLPESKEWKDAIYARDGLKCVSCGFQGKRYKMREKKRTDIHIDHIVPFSYLIRKYGITQSIQVLVYPEFWDIKNGRVLCIPCHYDTPTFSAKALQYKELAPPVG